MTALLIAEYMHINEMVNHNMEQLTPSVTKSSHGLWLGEI